MTLAGPLSRIDFTDLDNFAAGFPHDENISFAHVIDMVGAVRANQLRDLTLQTYIRAADHALTKGIIIADTKFEFGVDENGDLVLADEVFTPDSSRYWAVDTYREGVVQPSFDKQFVRDYLEEIRWNKQPPVPSLPDDVIRRTRDKYVEAYRLLTDRDLQ